ncbi:hypothetical protein [Herbaspirillum sp. RV1423]|uniref:hypothetical protein n=1 Tax=Herbaspirillum sp. RV1423 TaxID=1443993 RepID=UPI0004B7F423|nr:hypothetical protein [Herbaspirillum sp. RV1423]
MNYPAPLKASNAGAIRLSAIAADPVGARALHTLQVRAGNRLQKIIEKVAAILIEQAMATHEPQARWPAGMRHFTSAGRRRERTAKECRALAEDLVMAALKNLDNPDWDPTLPDSRQPGSQNQLLMLLQSVANQAVAATD